MVNFNFQKLYRRYPAAKFKVSEYLKKGNVIEFDKSLYEITTTIIYSIISCKLFSISKHSTTAVVRLKFLGNQTRINKKVFIWKNVFWCNWFRNELKYFKIYSINGYRCVPKSQREEKYENKITDFTRLFEVVSDLFSENKMFL